ncbi:ATP-dependent nuclease [Coraliomargarita akajimensis]|uniref:Endonuclease GajA/Old nuclease/RecF-like AAA domain-containing protein n=1 Tax=Coraliomargarita akajimensis (strain DSM 45221 / IAM 15411 / JCM 23193 / KCTC 12865 / 04OKA010-24) TaxID=583355 RepID=D5EL71_CORAD|nr:AAA family ATPase [Coraliomargarita akajimensis]ADE53173.1 hypothetical protein Caka_0144 [Coraliomargarita akajimensis DSM 45221]
MKFISKITIKYFRSLHSVDLKKCSSVNVISGRNDVGKSNVIKALNLFFNGSSDWNTAFDFYDNFSTKRLEEVRRESVKGRQFISVKVEFVRPNNYRGSLPERFSVERRWHRDSVTYEQSTNLVSLEKGGKLPASMTAAQRSLATFLNKIHFEYVPAIRDRSYVTQLLGRLQRSLLNISLDSDSELLETANVLATHVEGQITELKDDFHEATEIETSIVPPTNMADLFQSFLVSTRTSEGAIALKFRGDGLQSRYIASVLHYIAQNSNDFHIWGYEEPEIALEYSHVCKMAGDFLGKYSDAVQIFTSTHSPAFISLESDEVSCFRVTREGSESGLINATATKSGDCLEQLKDDLGVIEIQKEVHELYTKRLEELAMDKVRLEVLEAELAENQLPLLVTEGKTDKIILEEAYEKLHGDGRVRVRCCDNSAGDRGGSGGAGALGKLIESVHPEDERVVIAIFDNDKEGQHEFSRLSKNFTCPDWSNAVKRHRNGCAWALLLNEPDFRAGYIDAKNLCIEYLFTDQVLNREFPGGGKLQIKAAAKRLIIGDGEQMELPHEVSKLIAEDTKKFGKIGSGKDEFASEIVPDLPKEEFSAFSLLFECCFRIIEDR